MEPSVEVLGVILMTPYTIWALTEAYRCRRIPYGSSLSKFFVYAHLDERPRLYWLMVGVHVVIGLGVALHFVFTQIL